ncbi:MAG: ParB-like protein [Mycobacterium sp.]
MHGDSATPITPEQLHARLDLKDFGNDRYRSVLYFARDIGFHQHDSSPAFQEFLRAR